MLASALCSLCGCSLDLSPEKDAGSVPASCTQDLRIEGRVEESEVAAPGYVRFTEWFVYAIDEQALDRVGQEAMRHVGLDPNQEEDVARYRYWTNAFDLRFLARENPPTIGAFPVDRDLGIYLYDLLPHNVQPDDEVAVFDISSIEALRGSESRSALGEEIRRLVDEMRDNGKPDAIVAFSFDRSEEKLPTNLLINLFAPNTRFATSGYAKFYDVTGRDGTAQAKVSHPVRDIQVLSVAAEVSFGSDAVVIEEECAPLTIVDLRD